MNIILKARQWGGTTFVDIYYLDECLFNDNIEAGIIAHNREDAQKIFRRKVQFPYRNLPDALKEHRYPTTDSQKELAFNNNSIIYVGTSMRSGTLHYLHISEHGKICKKYPEKAEEIKTGSLNAVDAGQMIVIESTAEGAFGDFYNFCEIARSNEGKELTPLDWKFHFFAWFHNKEYSIDPKGVEISKEFNKYFNTIEKTCDVALSQGQRAWYVKKERTLTGKMKQEFPSTPDEAFESGMSALPFSKDHHVLKENIPVPNGAPLYMTFDWGYGKPYSVGYWWVDADGRLYRFSEIYGNDKDPSAEKDMGLRQSDTKIAEVIKDHEIDLDIWGKDIIRLCDPTCFNKKPNYEGKGQGPSTAENFAKHGIYLNPGDPSRSLKIRQWYERLMLREDELPMVMVYPCCKDFIRTIPLLTTDEHNPEDIDTTQEDHIYDEASHAFMARPIAMLIQTKPKTEAEKILDELIEPDSLEDEIFEPLVGGDDQPIYE